MEYRFDALPETIEQFQALSADLTRPETTCALLVAALHLYVQDKEQGIRAMNLLRGPRPLSAHEEQFLRDCLRDKPYLPLAYFEGAAPENNYTPNRPYVLKVLPDPRAQDVEPGYLRRYLTTAGADSPRAVKLRRKGQNWYLWEHFGLLPGIRIPVKEDPWA